MLKFTVHKEFVESYLKDLITQYKLAFSDSRSLTPGINPFFESKLLAAMLPLSINDEFSQIINNLDLNRVGGKDTNNVKSTLTNSDGTSAPSSGEDSECSLEKWFEQCSYRVLQLYGGIIDTLYILCNNIPSTIACIHFLERYFIYAILDKLEDKYKFHTGHLVCSLMPPTTPPKGDLYQGELPGVIVGGWVRRFFCSSKQSMEFKIKVAMSLQNAKRAAAAISDEKQQKALRDHCESMLGIPYKVLPRQEQHLVGVMDKIEKLVNFYYPEDFLDHIPTWRIPSISACHNGPRKFGGAMGAILKMDYVKSNHYQDDKGRPCGRALSHGYMTCNGLDIPVFSFGFSIEVIKKHMQEYIENVQTVEADYHQVLEPFKVRGITAADPIVYHFGRLLQKPLHGFLRSERGPFRFIGKRNNVADIRSVYAGSCLFTLDEFDRQVEHYGWRIGKHMFTSFVAGDYRAATDNMHPYLPEAFIAAFLKRTSSRGSIWEKVLNLTLGPHNIFYGCGNGSIISEWGQLMGAPTSFPVLNIVNAAMFWQSCCIYEKDERLSWINILKKYRVLFNGDDICFLSNPHHYMVWEDVCTGCGLGLSPGKNYFTDRFVNINSTNYKAIYSETVNSLKVCLDFEEEFIVNSGLVKGQAKVQNDSRRDDLIEKGLGDHEEDSLMSVCDQLEECVRVASAEERERTYEIFRFHLEGRLKKSQRPWSLPRFFGGFGLPFGEETVKKAHIDLALKQLVNYRDLSDLKEKWFFNESSNEYVDQLLQNLKVLERETYRYVDDDSYLHSTPGKVVPIYSPQPLVFESPSLSHLFLCPKSSKKIRNFDKEGNPRHTEHKYVQALRNVQKKKSTLTDKDLIYYKALLSTTNFKLEMGGLNKQVLVSAY